MRKKAKAAAWKKVMERRALERKLGIPESDSGDIAYDLEALKKNKKLIKQNRASARKLRVGCLQ